jgi:chaperonin GroEL
LDDFGHVKRVEIDKDKTTLIEGGGVAEKIEARIRQTRTEIERSISDYDKEKLEERTAKLSGGVAVIKVGAATETEMKERKFRVQDAPHANRAAVEEGIAPGDGIGLLRVRRALGGLKGANRDHDAGIRIVWRALEAPLWQIVENAGEVPSIVSSR